MAESITKRNILVKSKMAQRLIEKQNNKCYWCHRPFGMFYIKNGKTLSLAIHIDHIIPYTFCQKTEENNLVASCSICNKFKYSKHFHNEEDCFLYLTFRWAKALKNKKIILLQENSRQNR